MSRATAITNKLNNVLKRFGPGCALVYTRFVTTTGDDLIGRTQTNAVDTLLDPQPFYQRLGRERVPGGHVETEMLTDSQGRALMADDYEILFSASNMSRAMLNDNTMLIVLKWADGAENVMRVLDYDDVSLNGTDISYTVYCRNTGRN